MTTNKPKIKIYEPSEKGVTAMRKASFRNTGPERYVRLSDYEDLKAECESLRKAAQVSAADASDNMAKSVCRTMLDTAPAVQGEPDASALVEALTPDLSARINRVSRRSLDGSVVMSSEEWNGIVELAEKLLTAATQADTPC